MRGEEPTLIIDIVPRQELPPHARRRERLSRGRGAVPGITSACAEKSGQCLSGKIKSRNYLRMRGEESF